MPFEASSCGTLTYKAKHQRGLNRVEPDSELWDFVETWVRRFRTPPPAPRRGARSAPETGTGRDFEKFIFLWVSINAWASMAVPDQTRNHEDTYLVHSMARDPELNEQFSRLLKNDRFSENVKALAELGPVFQVLWLRNKGISAWRKEEGESRADYVARVFGQDPFHRVTRNDQVQKFPAFSPACAEKHLTDGENIPADWPHLLHMIYQVRCNLFHGGKTYESAADRAFVDLAFKILWRVWQQVVPSKVCGLISWRRAFIRSGIRFAESEAKLLLVEPEENISFVRKVLDVVGWASHLDGDEFRLPPQDCDEQEWLAAWEHCRGGAEGGPTGFENIELAIMDTHMSGVVRWLNGLGVETGLSCEGHAPGQRCWLVVGRGHEDRAAELIARNSGRQLVLDGDRIIRRGETARPPAKEELLRLAECLHGEYIAKALAQSSKTNSSIDSDQ